MKKIFGILIYVVLFFGITGCTNKENTPPLKSDETFMSGYTLDDGRLISFTFDVPYHNDYLSEALMNDKISIDEFINQLDNAGSFNDGGSKLYKYTGSKRTFGNEDFYVLVCNSTDGIKDIYVAKNRNSLTDKCLIKINDLDGVTMEIKEGTLTNVGATIIITDTSSRNNIYGEPYRIDRFVDGKWQEVDVVIEGNYAWTSIGYSVGEDNKLELKMNWEWLYGKLEKGKYRIVKDTSYAGEGTTHYITVEFELK